MLVKDFLLQIRTELDEKSNVKFWKDEELFFKLQRCYITLQFDLPYFINREKLFIQEGKSECYLTFTALKNISLVIDGDTYSYSDIENIFNFNEKKLYTFDDNLVLLNQTMKKDTVGLIRYRYEKELKNINCRIELPRNYFKALRFLLMSEIHEKPKLNTKERNLSEYYVKKYDKEIVKLTKFKKARVKNIRSNYQII